MSLYDRILPPSALRWGRLTAGQALTRDDIAMTDASGAYIEPCRHEGAHMGGCVRLPECAAPCFYTSSPVDPAALWGEHDRRAEGQQ